MHIPSKENRSKSRSWPTVKGALERPISCKLARRQVKGQDGKFKLLEALTF